MARMTKTERIAREGLMKNLIHLNRDGWISSMLEDVIPEAWHTLEADLDVEEKKEKVTLYLDRSVLRVFRAMGNGYQARINRLLATWVQMKIAQEIKLDDFLDKRVRAPVADKEGSTEDATPEAESTVIPAKEGKPVSGDDDDDDGSPLFYPEIAVAFAEIRAERLAQEAREAEEQERERNSMSVWERVGLEDERRRKAEQDALEEGYRRRALEREARDLAREKARDTRE
jgi:hypothetical protein